MSTPCMPVWTRPLRVALIAPAGCVDPSVHVTTLQRLTAAGITPVDGRWSHARHRYMGGDIQTRLADLYDAFRRDDVDAVWCLRGGYGSAQLIPHMDWGLLQRLHPRRALMGYSDITVLLNAFHRHGRPVIHSPVATDIARMSWPPTASCPRSKALASIETAMHAEAGHMPIQHLAGPTQAITGTLQGGNLMTLATLCGTSAALTLNAPTLLMLEEINEPDYCIERSFYQLLQTLDRRHLRGVCLGSFTRHGRPTRSCYSMFAEWLRPMGIPLYGEAPFGHQEDNQAWPYGVPATLSAQGLFWHRMSHIH